MSLSLFDIGKLFLICHKFRSLKLQDLTFFRTNDLKFRLSFITTPSSLILFTGSNIFPSNINLKFRDIFFGLKILS